MIKTTASAPPEPLQLARTGMLRKTRIIERTSALFFFIRSYNPPPYSAAAASVHNAYKLTNGSYFLEKLNRF